MKTVWVYDDWKSGKKTAFSEYDTGLRYVIDKITDNYNIIKFPKPSDDALKEQAHMQLEEIELVLEY